jgi:hypothetical protein
VVVASESSAGGLKNALPTVAGWLQSEVAARRVLAAVWLETGASNRPSSGVPAVASPLAEPMRRARVHHRDRPPQGVSHRSGARPLRDRHRGAASHRGSTPARPAARVRCQLHAPHLGHRVGLRARRAARPAAGGGGRVGAGCTADPVGSGPVARFRLHRQDRPPRRPSRGDRGATAQPAAPGYPGGSHRGAAAAARPAPRPHRAPNPRRSAGFTPCSVA